jgi:hypothetical protein
MAAVIALRPETDRGGEILDELEQRTRVQPDQIADDGTRRYNLHGNDVDVNALDPMLDKIDPDWREHIANRRGKPLRRSNLLTLSA